ncbi:MAG TPA: DEDD exonuclease domain-containing protein [Candidatus Kapabacteria bacterium]|nr:DEDD exonuclease domain-containing protein [Candidatus Kapabacteria bacterium]
MLSLADATFIVTDVETTGLSPERNRVTEVACVLVRGREIVGEHTMLVNPEQHIPQAIQQMTGITNAMVFSAPKGERAFPDVRSWMPDEGIFTAHNVMFDFNFLQASFRRHGVQEMRQPKLCTARLARRVLPPQKSWALQHLAAYFGIKIKGRHRAMGDALATARALMEMLDILADEHECETVEDVLSVQYSTMDNFKEPPRHVTALAPTLRSMPPRPGVYRMLDTRGQILYVGKAKSLRERVNSYFRIGAIHTKKIAEMVRRVRKIEIDETGSELGALLLESRLIKELQPKYNTLQKRYRRYAFIRLDRNDPFPRVETAMEIEPDGAEYYGPFRTRGDVNAMIDTINHAFALRECSGTLTPDADIVPCFYHQIKRCGAPCARAQSPMEYALEVDRVRGFLSGGESGIISVLEKRMSRHAEALEFEEAAEVRNRIEDLRRIFKREERIADSVNNNNVIIVLPAAARDEQEIFLVRFGRLVAQVIVKNETPEAEIRALVEQHYFSGAVAPEHCRREEIDEIRIIAVYLHQQRGSSTLTYVNPGDTIEGVLDRALCTLRLEQWRRETGTG